jgi:hypothetical protein
MQGEDWSELVASNGLRHTSMSVGDVAIDHKYRVAYIVDRMGL